MQKPCLMLCALMISATLFAFQLRPGDLLFQDINCGAMCNDIFTVTHGYANTDLSHVGMVVPIQTKAGTMELKVIEASGSNVHLTPLNQFLARSVDHKNRPRVLVGRLAKRYQTLIPQAIKVAQSWIGSPYNADFTPHNLNNTKTSNPGKNTFYCSQLIYDAFKKANHGKSIFAQHHMTFNNPMTHRPYPGWVTYFKQLHKPIPQGELGTNPGMMSRSRHVKILCRYGYLRQKQNLERNIPLCPSHPNNHPSPPTPLQQGERGARAA